ncbi:MAG: HAD hydrolase-like protein [Candidatus Promineifilaceae bacterium]
MQLLLFDIDGTLLRSNGAGKSVLVKALEDVFGTSGPYDDYDMAGKTDPLIISDLMCAAGKKASEIDRCLPTVYERMMFHAQKIFSDNSIFPCPGVPELLEALLARKDVIIGLLTGNIEGTAPLKLAAAGIEPSIFRVGAYGSDHKDRNQLPPFALRRAAELTKLLFHGENTTIIGDTPADIACARTIGARVVAVGSGSYSSSTLNQFQPDFLFENFLNRESALEALIP